MSIGARVVVLQGQLRDGNPLRILKSGLVYLQLIYSFSAPVESRGAQGLRSQEGASGLSGKLYTMMQNTILMAPRYLIPGLESKYASLGGRLAQYVAARKGSRILPPKPFDSRRIHELG